MSFVSRSLHAPLNTVRDFKNTTQNITLKKEGRERLQRRNDIEKEDLNY